MSSGSTVVGEAKITLRFEKDKLTGDIKSVEKDVTSFAERVQSGVAANLSSKVLEGFFGEMKRGFSEIINVGSSFESSMAKVQAVSGATAADFEKLQAKAREMGKTTVFSASESAEAFNYMAMAGWDTADMLDGIEGVMNLAAASGTDLATTSDIVTDALTAMGYSAKSTGKFADVMAAASANANTNVKMMGESFKYAASVAGSLGDTIEDTSVALGLMANSGIKAEQAGTSLRSILSRMAAPTKEVKNAMDALGVSLTDDQGNMRSLDDVMKDLRSGFSKLSATQKAEAAESIAGKNAMTGLLAIVNASEADYQKLTKAVNNSTGAAKNMADTMNDTVSGKMKLVQSQLEEIYLTIWEKLSPSITKALEKVQVALSQIDWDAVGEMIGNMFSVLVDGFTWVIEHGDLVVGVFQAVIAAMAVKKVADFVASISEVAGGIKKVLPVVQSLSEGLLGLAANPIALVIAGIAGVAAGMIGVSSAMKEAELGLDNAIGAHARMNKALDESRASLKRNQDEWDRLKIKQAEAVAEGLKEINYYQQLANELDLIVDKNGKVKDGYEARAQFITTTLASELGTEINISDGVIQNYQTMRDEVNKTIEAKKAELILANQEEIYQEALSKRTDIVKQIRQVTEEQRLAEEQGREEDRLRIASHLADLQGQFEQYTLTVGQYENNMALYSAGQYDDMTQTIYQYSDQYKTVEEAVKATLEEEAMMTASSLGANKHLYETTGEELWANQQSTAQRKLDGLNDEMTKYFGTTETYLVETTKAWDKNLEQQLSAVTGRKVEFLDAGNGLVDMMIDGIKAKEGMTREAMSKLTSNTITEIKIKKQEALNAGTNLINGVNDGLKNGAAQKNVINTATLFARGVEGTFKSVWDERSPSRVSEGDGLNLVYGVGNGIGNLNAQRGVFGVVASFSAGIVRQFQDSLQIRSPSRIMRDVIGKNIAAGIGVGFEDEIGEVEKDMQDEVKSLASDIYAEVPQFDYSVSGTASTMLSNILETSGSTDDALNVRDERKEPLIVQLMLDGKQIQQVILQDIRRTI